MPENKSLLHHKLYNCYLWSDVSLFGFKRNENINRKKNRVEGECEIKEEVLKYTTISNIKYLLSFSASVKTMEHSTKANQILNSLLSSSFKSKLNHVLINPYSICYIFIQVDNIVIYLSHEDFPHPGAWTILPLLPRL